MKLKILILMSLMTLSLLNSQWVVNTPEFLVSTDLQHGKGYPAIAELKDGGFIVCWESHDQDGDKSGIFGQKFNIQKQKVDDEFQINTNSIGNQLKPKVVALQNGDVLLCWATSSNRIIMGQLFDPALQKKGTEFQINTKTSAYPYEVIVSFSNSSFVCCWPIFLVRNFVTGVAGQRFSASGTKIGNEFLVTSETDIDTLVGGPAILPLYNNEFMIYWVCDKRFYSSPREVWEIHGQRFDSAGNKNATKFKLETSSISHFGSLDFSNLTAVKFPNQNTLLAWSGHLPENSSRDDFFYLVFDPFGLKSGAEHPAFSTGYKKTNLAIAPFSDGSLFMCCQEDFYDSHYIIHRLIGQWINSSGQKIGTIFQIAEPEDEIAYYFPAVFPHQDREVIICYEKVNEVSSRANPSIMAKVIPRPQVYALEPFNLLEPQNDATITTNRPIFKWRQPGHDKEFYPFEFNFELYLDTDPDFSHPKIFYDIADTCYSPPPIDSLKPERTYFWKVLAKNIGHDSLWSNQKNWGFFVKRGASAVLPQLAGTVPVRYSLKQNYSNPFNATTTIPFDLPQRSKVKLIILDLKGREITTLLKEELPAGVHQVVFDATELPSGVYLYRIQTEDFCQTRKLLLVK